jgi:respiratory-subunit NADH dehydrogenase subunit
VALKGQSVSLSTVIDVWPAANWYEREVWDTFGVGIDGRCDCLTDLHPSYCNSSCAHAGECFFGDHKLVFGLTLSDLAVAFASLLSVAGSLPRALHRVNSN